jgi:hypothetical protein
VKKPEDIATDAGHDRVKNAKPPVELPAAEAHANSWTQAWAKVRSWFKIPYGYEDETGFHYGHEPAPVTAAATPSISHKVFTDRACDSEMFMAGTSTETSPAPAPEPEISADLQREKRELKVNPS